MRQGAELERLRWDVLIEYPAEFVGMFWASLGNAGGFSGARLWKGTAADGRAFCLRAWPAGRITEDKLRATHLAMSACRLPIVPALVRTHSRATWLAAGGRYWEMSTWLPGTADFHQHPTDKRLFAAMRALATIHATWTPAVPRTGPAPAVGRIIKALRNWRALVEGGWKPDFQLPYPDGVEERARRAWEVLHRAVIGLEFAFLEWESRPVPMQTCICDVWHDHILYTGEEVTGVIDYGAVKEDCVAVDLARLLGSLIPDEPERLNLALGVYSAARPVPPEVLRLVPVLDRVGCVVGLSNWIRWLYHERRPFQDFGQVVRRMDILIKRLDKRTAAGGAAMGFELPSLPKR